jgi:hypothetical protein
MRNSNCDDDDDFFMRESFKTIDTDRSGLITPHELQRALGEHGKLLFSLQTIALMVKMHSIRNQGDLDLEEYKQLSRFLHQTQNVFAKYSSKNSQNNKLRKCDVFKALTESGFGMLDVRAVEEACKTFDPSRENVLGVDQYVALVLFLMSAKKVFNQFDVEKKDSVTLDLNQFIFASSRTR